MIGETLDGKYRILRKIGEGGMGSVYEAETIDTGARVAVKVMNSQLLVSGKGTLSRFRREARAASAIGNPHIVRILDAQIFEVVGGSYIVMECLSGEDLQHLIDRTGPLAPQAVLRIAAQALDGLMAAHRANVVHRDIKPANIFLARAPSGEIVVKLLDFGIAKIKADPLQVSHTTNVTTSGNILGSPLYMSPEQVQGSSDVDHRTDLWSLGSVLYCALAGRAPHQHHEALGRLLVAICVSSPPGLQDVTPWVSPEIVAFIHKALKVRPEDRYATASAMFTALRPLLPPDGYDLREEMVRPVSEAEGVIIGSKLAPHPAPDVSRVVVRPPPRAGADANIDGGDRTVPARELREEVDAQRSALDFLVGTWRDPRVGSTYYVRRVDGELRCVYCYNGNDALTGEFYGWRPVDRMTLFAYFRWLRHDKRVRGYAYFSVESRDKLVGGWRSDKGTLGERGVELPPRDVGVPFTWIRQSSAFVAAAWVEAAFQELARGSVRRQIRAPGGK